MAVTGDGSGRVQSTNAQFEPDGIIDCPILRGIVDTTKCSNKYPDSAGTGVVVYIRAIPDPGSELCDENGCTTDVRKRSRLFTASGTFAETFNLLVYDVSVAKAGSGKGRITSDPPYLNCGDSCETSLEYGAELKLIADPDPGSRFSKWTGACAGQGATCEITLTGDMASTATFTAVAVATAEPSEEPSAEPIETLVATGSPTATIAPTVEPTPASTPDPSPSDAGGSGPVVIFLAVLLAALLVALGFVAVRGRRQGMTS